MQAYSKLANELLANQGRNQNGCYVTCYGNIRGLKVLASDTNGWSGIGIYRGQRVYWHLDQGYQWSPEYGLTQVRKPTYVVERA